MRNSTPLLCSLWARQVVQTRAHTHTHTHKHKHTLTQALVEAAQRAGLDEIRHARLCFKLARAYSGNTVEPSRFPIPAGRVSIERSLEELAVATGEEGCVEETISCILAFVALERATAPAVLSVLSQIVEDEARHAALVCFFVFFFASSLLLLCLLFACSLLFAFIVSIIIYRPGSHSPGQRHGQNKPAKAKPSAMRLKQHSSVLWPAQARCRSQATKSCNAIQASDA